MAERISDADRDRVVAELRHHTGLGRLTLDEFDERVALVLAATDRHELDSLTGDLPAVLPPPGAHASAPPPPPTQLLPRRWCIAVLSSTRTSGRWRLSGHTHAVAVLGGVQVDLTEAEIDPPVATVYTVAVFGGIEVLVPEGMPVEIGGIALFGSNRNELRKVAVVEGLPLVRVRAFSLFGSAAARSHPFRRGVTPR